MFSFALIMKAYHLTSTENARSILAQGTKKKTYFFPKKLFPECWKKSTLAEDLVSQISSAHKKNQDDPLVVLCAEIIPGEDDAIVNSLYARYSCYEVRYRVSLEEYLSKKYDFSVPEIMVKNIIPPERIHFGGFLDESNFAICRAVKLAQVL